MVGRNRTVGRVRSELVCLFILSVCIYQIDRLAIKMSRRVVLSLSTLE